MSEKIAQKLVTERINSLNRFEVRQKFVATSTNLSWSKCMTDTSRKPLTISHTNVYEFNLISGRYKAFEAKTYFKKIQFGLSIKRL